MGGCCRGSRSPREQAGLCAIARLGFRVKGCAPSHASSQKSPETAACPPWCPQHSVATLLRGRACARACTNSRRSLQSPSAKWQAPPRNFRSGHCVRDRCGTHGFNPWNRAWADDSAARAFRFSRLRCSAARLRPDHGVVAQHVACAQHRGALVLAANGGARPATSRGQQNIYGGGRHKHSCATARFWARRGAHSCDRGAHSCDRQGKQKHVWVTQALVWSVHAA